MEGLLAAFQGATILLRDAVDGLYVHEQVVPDTEAPPTLLTLRKVETQNKHKERG